MSFPFELSEEMQHAIEDMGYEEPTPIQKDTIPLMLAGRDLIGQAQTGTGKTAAFGIPLIEHADPADRSVQAVVLCPTRELALQTAGELTKLSKYKTGIHVLAVYGGQPIERQLYGLKLGVQIVVGTPGRVMDHLRRGSLSLASVRTAILDEADEMLDMGFRDDIEEILSQTNPERQTALYSATMPYPILTLAAKYLKEPEMIRVERKTLTVEAVEQTYISVRSFHKCELLARLLVRDNITRALVFCNTKKGVEDLVTGLHAKGFSVNGLHGDMRQIERDAIMARFRQGMVGVLIATDVAARGLDIDDVEAVFNYDLPLDVENYIHRIGRTGRAGKTGRAYSFVVGREVSRMWEYRKITGAKILCEKAPAADEIRSVQRKRLSETILEKTLLLTPSQVEDAQALLDSIDPTQAVAVLVDMISGADKRFTEEDLSIPEPERKPRPVRSETPKPPVRKPAPKGRRFPTVENRRDIADDRKRAPYRPHEKREERPFGRAPKPERPGRSEAPDRTGRPPRKPRPVRRTDKEI